MTKYYIIHQVGTENYIGYDSASGGYPYAGTFISAANSGGITQKIPKIPTDSYLYTKGEKYEICEIQFKLYEAPKTS